MSIVDTIKKSVLSEFTGTITIEEMLFSLLIAFVIGLFIIYIYKKTYTGVVYSKAFSLCMIMLAMVTALIIRTISSNISLSLGMVGALSIVRFRTAVKEPVDTGFMFWAISAGIMAGAGLYVPALAGSAILGLLFYVSYLLGFKVSSRYLLILKYEKSAHDEVMKALKKLPKNKLRSKSMYGNEIELTYEIDIRTDKKTKKINDNFMEDLDGVWGMVNASLIAYQNDFGD
ncbi:MAG TPA: DUF4956 domain-containing protein [Bacilli bacterium]|nr:DUF4956 domain-containing protein [Bacilli bacterium]